MTAVLLGVVLLATPAWTLTATGDTLIVTTYTIAVQDGTRVEVRREGGTIGDLTLTISEQARWTVGQRVRLEGETWVLDEPERPETEWLDYGAKWPTGKMTYYVNPANADGLDPARVISEIRAAAEAWQAQSRTTFRAIYGGTTGATVAQPDYVNNVFFSSEANGSTIAVTYYWHNGQGALVDTDIKYYDGGFRFFLSADGNCNSGGEYVLDPGVHEFGHCFGLAHSSDVTATMYPTAHYCDVNWRTLAPDDIAGIESLYAPTTAAPAPPSQVRVGL